MSPFDFEQLVALGGSDLPRLSELIVRMVAATVLGAFLAFRGWRPLARFVVAPSIESAQAQTLIATAGAVMVVVIGDSSARAFGLVGLGSFIRFRSGISDPRDAAVMFVMIGIGMACGVGAFSMAIGATLFIACILTVFDATRHRVTTPTLVAINAEDAAYVRGEVERIYPGVRVIEAASNAPELGKDSGKLVVQLELEPSTDASSISKVLTMNQVRGIRRVALVADD